MPLIASVVLTVLVPRRMNVVVPVGIVTGPNTCPPARSNFGPRVGAPGVIDPPVKVNVSLSWTLNSSGAGAVERVAGERDARRPAAGAGVDRGVGALEGVIARCRVEPLTVLSATARSRVPTLNRSPYLLPSIRVAAHGVPDAVEDDDAAAVDLAAHDRCPPPPCR